MGILNVTPDSFSDGGRFLVRDAALRQAEAMLADGAAILDVGGESTRPGASDVSEAAELDRVIPVIEAIREISDAPVSIDTSKPAVMRAGVAAGANMINDIRALREEGAVQTVADLAVPVCLMHMQGAPGNMQSKAIYENVTVEVFDFLNRRIVVCEKAGIRREMIVVDPGFGFGKNDAHNLELLASLGRLQSLGCPILAGLSRKRTLGAITGRGVEDRMSASIAAATIAVMQGATIVRVHDVAGTVDAVRVATAVLEVGKVG